MTSPRHLLALSDLHPDEIRSLLKRAIELKHLKTPYEPMRNRVLGMIFEKASTRTRVSFEVGMAQFGGSSIFLSPRDTQLGRGEPIEDSARVLSRMVDMVMLRTFSHETVVRFAEFSRVPVINGLTDRFHPCQVLADLQTFLEHRGDIQGHRVAWIGDGNNMCQTYMEAAQLLDFELVIASPEGYDPDPQLLASSQQHVRIERDPHKAAHGASLVVTDVWASMGQEEEQQERLRAFNGYEVNSAVMHEAAPDALFMHCLPAHRGEEVSGEVFEGSQSVVWDEAENRLHAQKALMEMLLLHVS
ncbi:MAG: hypothetical protein RIQ52_1170 [Pseudomonadota bacterium]|jgi:ornithine carbamoyltransferase